MTQNMELYKLEKEPISLVFIVSAIFWPAKNTSIIKVSFLLCDDLCVCSELCLGPCTFFLFSLKFLDCVIIAVGDRVRDIELYTFIHG